MLTNDEYAAYAPEALRSFKAAQMQLKAARVLAANATQVYKDKRHAHPLYAELATSAPAADRARVLRLHDRIQSDFALEWATMEITKDMVHRAAANLRLTAERIFLDDPRVRAALEYGDRHRAWNVLSLHVAYSAERLEHWNATLENIVPPFDLEALLRPYQ